MKILLYNWVNYDDAQQRGGGVRVYHANLVSELTRIPGTIVYTLSSGLCYDLFDRRVRIRRRPGRGAVRSYEIVNSPIAAPAHAAFASLDVYLNDKTLVTVVQEFLKEHGPFDVIQFDNLEGLTAGVLALKERFPHTRFIYYMHNYNLLCPQVNLWFAESEACDDFGDGAKCTVCLPERINMREVKVAHSISTFLEWVGIAHDSWVFRTIYRQLARAKSVRRLMRHIVGRVQPAPTYRIGAAAHTDSPIESPFSSGFVYRQYRANNIRIVNDHFDHVLAVSSRVREIAIQSGIAVQKVSVAYIGSRVAMERLPIRVRDRDHLKIAYLGYERRDKGFYHFLDTLEAIPRSAARRISVLVAARLRSPETGQRLKNVSVAFQDFQIVDGYDHRSLARLLDDVDLGIVPVLWEDNLPQVAIEFVAHGVPVLSSELGGTKELCGANSRFVYRHGDVRDLIAKLQLFLDNRAALSSYADHALTLLDMARHAKILLERYYPAPAPLPSSVPDHAPMVSDAAGTRTP